MRREVFTNDGSIVFRLRLSFGLIFIALAVFGTFSQLNFDDILKRKNDLTQRAIPLLVRAQDLVARLSLQTQQIVSLRDIDTTADFEEIARVAAVRHAQILASIIAYQALSPDKDLQGVALTLDELTTSLIAHQTHRQKLALQRLDQLVALRAIIDGMDIQIEGLRLDVLTDFQTSIGQLGNDPDGGERIGSLSILLNTLVW